MSHAGQHWQRMVAGERRAGTCPINSPALPLMLCTARNSASRLSREELSAFEIKRLALDCFQMLLALDQ